jgi:hypothetical protein
MTDSGTSSSEDPSALPQDKRDGADRRREPRYVPAMRGAYLGWWESETYRMPVARLECLSCNGAALIVEQLPAGTKSVWLSLIGLVASNWIPANVVNTIPCADGRLLVRLALSESLPYDIFKTFCLGWSKDQFPARVADLSIEETAASES